MHLKPERYLIDFLKLFRSHSTFSNKNSGVQRFNIVHPYPVTPQLTVGEEIVKPDYWKSGIPNPAPKDIEIKNEKEILILKESCKLAKDILYSLHKFIQVGVTTDEIDGFVHKLCIENGAYPSPLNYHKFPKSVCTSVNNVACHGIPDLRPLEDGDILNVDVTVYKKGMHGDTSAMFLVGEVDKNGQKLCSVAKEALEAGISVCKPGQPFSAIGQVIEEVAKTYDFTVVPAFVGHGIGSYFHGPPDIYHFDVSGTSLDSGLTMMSGMTFTIEPVISEGGNEILILEDGWTAITTDNSRSAQWEHTVLITNDGAIILT